MLASAPQPLQTLTEHFNTNINKDILLQLFSSVKGISILIKYLPKGEIS